MIMRILLGLIFSCFIAGQAFADAALVSAAKDRLKHRVPRP